MTYVQQMPDSGGVNRAASRRLDWWTAIQNLRHLRRAHAAADQFAKNFEFAKLAEYGAMMDGPSGYTYALVRDPLSPESTYLALSKPIPGSASFELFVLSTSSVSGHRRASLEDYLLFILVDAGDVLKGLIELAIPGAVAPRIDFSHGLVTRNFNAAMRGTILPVFPSLAEGLGA